MGTRYPTSPDARSKNAYRCKQALAVAAVTAAATPLDEYINIAGSAKVTARLKATAAGTLDLTLGYMDGEASTFTPYTTGNPTQVAVVANTEAQITQSLSGENWARLRFTPSGTGVVTYVDVAQI